MPPNDVLCEKGLNALFFAASALRDTATSVIILENISLRRGSKLLMQNASATLQPGQKLALIGANGTGKSSLFSLLLGDLSSDQGHIRGMAGLRIAHMAQELTFKFLLITSW